MPSKENNDEQDHLHENGNHSARSILKGRYDSNDNIDVDRDSTEAAVNNNDRNDGADDEEDDDDDRKPPARIISSLSMVDNTAARSNRDNHRQANRGNDENDEDDDIDDDDISDDYGNSTYTPMKVMPPTTLGGDDDHWFMDPSNSKKTTWKNRGGSLSLKTQPTAESTMATIPIESGEGMMMLSSTSTQPSNTSIPPNRERQQQQDAFSLLSGNDYWNGTDARIILLWGAVMSLSSSFLVYELIPMNVQVAIVALIVSMIMMLRQIRDVLLRLYHRTIVQGNGIGERILPSQLFYMLTQQSLHELLLTESSSQQTLDIPIWMNMIIYFLPSLSNEQRIQYISRLPQNQQDQLYRHGLGYAIPMYSETVMRILMGHQRYENSVRPNNNNGNQVLPMDENLNWSSRQPPTSLLLDNEARQQPASGSAISPMSTLSSRMDSNNNDNANKKKSSLFTDDSSSVESDLGLDISSDMIITDHQATMLSQSLGLIVESPPSTLGFASPIPSLRQQQGQNEPSILQTVPLGSDGVVTVSRNATTTTTSTTTHNNNNNTTPDPTTENLVLFDAMATSMNTAMDQFIYRPIRNVATDVVVPRIASTFQYWNLRLFTMTTGIGVLGYWSGIYRTVNPFSTSWLSSLLTPSSSRNSSNDGHNSTFMILSSLYPTSQTIWTITAMSGVTSIGLTLYHRYRTMTIRSNSNNGSDNQQQHHHQQKQQPNQKNDNNNTKM